MPSQMTNEEEIAQELVWTLLNDIFLMAAAEKTLPSAAPNLEEEVQRTCPTLACRPSLLPATRILTLPSVSLSSSRTSRKRCHGVPLACGVRLTGADLQQRAREGASPVHLPS